jgi:hypothetical protein
MSEVTRVTLPEALEDLELLTEVCADLRAQGKIECWFPDEPGVVRTHAHAYYRDRLANRIAAGDALAARDGEPLAVIINNNEWLDTAGFAATTTEYGPAGAFIGGVHQNAALEARIATTLATIRREYNTRRVRTFADELAFRYGAGWEETTEEGLTCIRIEIGSDSFA